MSHRDRTAGFGRRIGATVYEAVLLGALLLAVGFALLPLVTPASEGATSVAEGPRSLYVMSARSRALSGMVMFALCGAYCTWLWSGGRRTLAMRTWRLVLRTGDGGMVAPSRALLRYLGWWTGPALALVSFIALEPSALARWGASLAALNYAWAIFDPEGQFLHDRLAGTRLRVEAPAIRPAV
jgi:hypothetical protein